MSDLYNSLITHRITHKSGEYDFNTVFLFAEPGTDAEGKRINGVEIWTQRKNGRTVDETSVFFDTESLDKLIVALIEHKLNLEKRVV